MPKPPRLDARSTLRSKAVDLRRQGANAEQITDVLQNLNEKFDQPLSVYEVARIATGKKIRSAGKRIIYCNGVEERYGISAPTRWRWEKAGLLPPRDVFIGGKAIGWRPETLETAESSQAAA